MAGVGPEQVSFFFFKINIVMQDTGLAKWALLSLGKFSEPQIGKILVLTSKIKSVETENREIELFKKTSQNKSSGLYLCPKKDMDPPHIN